MNNARIYARFSTNMQSEQSIDDQIRVCTEYAAERNLAVLNTYTDKGISGAAFGNRPGVQSVLADLKEGETLLVCDLSRLSRSQDLGPLLTRLDHRSVRIFGVQDGFDSASRTARMQAGLSGIMSEEFRAMIAARVWLSLESKAKEGKATGGKAYDNPEIVREIFQRFTDGQTMRSIANDLNRRGVSSPGANWKRRSNPRGQWVVSALHSLLQNERYIGRVVWNKSRWLRNPDTGIRKRIARPESEWIISECEPLIDQDTWDRAQARFASRTGQRGGKRKFLLSGLLECDECGSKLIIIGGSQRRYGCGRFHSGGEHACSNSLTVPRKVVEEHILAHIQSEMLSPEAIAAGVTLLREERAKAEREAPKAPENREIIELKRLVREGLLSPETAAPALSAARKRAKAQPELNLTWPSIKAWKSAVSNMSEILQGDDVDDARDALKGLLGTIRCKPAGDHLIAQWSANQIQLTGTGSVGRLVAGDCYSIDIPTSTRKSRG